jgi:hypothetical protein
MRLYYSQSPGRFGFFLSFNLPGNLSGIFKMRNSNLNDSVAKAKREDGGENENNRRKKKNLLSLAKVYQAHHYSLLPSFTTLREEKQQTKVKTSQKNGRKKISFDFACKRLSTCSKYFEKKNHGGLVEIRVFPSSTGISLVSVGKR